MVISPATSSRRAPCAMRTACRGSVADMPLSRRPADARRRCQGQGVDWPSRMPTITKIPILPISYGDAKPLLAERGRRPEDVALGDHLPHRPRPGKGPSQGRVELGHQTIRNIIAKIPAEAPDQWIIRGNHHDAWVNGRGPISGQVRFWKKPLHVRTSQAGMEAQTHDHILPGTAKNRGCSVDGMVRRSR